MNKTKFKSHSHLGQRVYINGLAGHLGQYLSPSFNFVMYVCISDVRYYRYIDYRDIIVDSVIMI